MPFEAHASRGVPRSMPHRELESTDLESLPRLELTIGWRGRFGRESEPGGLLGQAVVKRSVRRVQIDWSPGRALHCADAEDVIDMCVGQPDSPESPAPGIQFGQEHLGLLAG